MQNLQWYHSMANINFYKSHTWAFFVSSHSFPDIHFAKFVTIKIYVKVMMYNILSGAIQTQISDFIYDGKSNFAFSSGYLSTWEVWPRKFRFRSLSITFCSCGIQWRLLINSINVIRRERSSIFCASSYHLRDINFLKLLTLKIWVKVTCRITGLKVFDSKY